MRSGLSSRPSTATFALFSSGALVSGDALGPWLADKSALTTIASFSLFSRRTCFSKTTTTDYTFNPPPNLVLLTRRPDDALSRSSRLSWSALELDGQRLEVLLQHFQRNRPDIIFSEGRLTADRWRRLDIGDHHISGLAFEQCRRD